MDLKMLLLGLISLISLSSADLLRSSNPQEKVTQLLGSFKQSHISEQSTDLQAHSSFQNDCQESLKSFELSLESLRGDLSVSINDIESFQKAVDKYQTQSKELERQIDNSNKQLAFMRTLKDQQFQTHEWGDLLLTDTDKAQELLDSLRVLDRNSKQLQNKADELYNNYNQKVSQDLKVLEEKHRDIQETLYVAQSKLQDANIAYNEAVKSLGTLEKLQTEKQSICNQESDRFEEESQRRSQQINIVDDLISSLD